MSGPMKNPLVTTWFGSCWFVLIPRFGPTVYFWTSFFVERIAKNVYAFEYLPFVVDPEINNFCNIVLLCVTWKQLICAGRWQGFIFATSEPEPSLEVYPTRFQMDTSVSFSGNTSAFSMSIRCPGLKCVTLSLHCSLHLLTRASKLW